MEVDEKGKRKISWDYNKEGPKCFKWVSQETNFKPTVGLNLKSTVTQLGLGSCQSTKNCFFKVGEQSSKANLIPLTHSSATKEVPPAKVEFSMTHIVVLD